MFSRVDWSHSEDHMRAGHGVTVVQAEEALADPERVVINPDYASKTGHSVRVIGYANGAGKILTIIIAIGEDGREYGANGWEANERDRRAYENTRE